MFLEVSYMRKIFSYILIVIIIMILCGCGNTDTIVYEVFTGDNVKIAIDKKDGYTISSDNNFVISKNNQEVCFGKFITMIDYDARFKNINSGSVKLLDSGDSFKISYTLYNDEEGYNYLIKIQKSNTGVLINSNSQDSIKQCYDHIKISLE